METIGSTVVLAGLMALFLGLGTWLFVSFLLIGTVGLIVVNDMDPSRIGAIMSQLLWRSSSSWELSAIPLFILMGEIIFNTDVAQRLFRGLAPWVDRIPGRLLHANVGGCTIFAAICGSSIATTATVGRITIPELRGRKYDTNITLGSLAGAGSFGLMIPPSINLIIFGVIAELSIAKLFAAGVFPGLLLAGMYSGYIIFRCVMDPAKAPRSAESFTWRDRMVALVDLLPIAILIVVVLGSIYTGIATPSESATMGLMATVVLALVTKQLTFSIFLRALMSTVKTSTMILTLMAGASFLAAAMGYMHIPQQVSSVIVSLELSPYMLLFILAMFYIVLGCFLDGISLMVMTVPIVLPLIIGAGFDPIWFGIFLIIMTELALITPPVGLNLFVLQHLTKLGIGRLAWAALPFFSIMCVAAMIISIFPQIATWLPARLFS